MTTPIMHETKTHGKLSFPYTVYRGIIPEYIRSYPLHWHDEMEIIYVIGGSGIVTAQTNRHILKAGDMMILLPQVVHSIEQLDNMPMEYFNILFQFSLLGSGISDGCYEKYFKPLYDHTRTITPYLPAHSPLNRLLLPYICNLIENRRQKEDTYALMIKSNLFAIMHHLNQHCEQVSEAWLSLHSTYEKLKKLLSYVQKNYDKPITIAQAADICGFSPSHFMKLFKELTGRTFVQYLKDFRLEIAAGQLADGTLKIIEAAENAGFNNHSYFTRSFIEKYGISPSEYQKEHQKGRVSCS
ncbi:MAG: AraC family transcriptional regulator [Lachnospiraceae bacterium]|nr:AraC family transcriptional regulator [Lachnospiraceae bacterium]MDE6184766.1 AraC family transcriptional regulator [Lachnospiraceae bacterium]MDE7287502.1 AraC family transcriptional regulator [Lachnospiraceae bacterium]